MRSADGPVVELDGVWRRYRRHPRPTSLRGALARGPSSWRPEWMWALQDVSLDVHRAGATAIVGANGAGKSTLLRLVGGIGRPDRGRVQVRGRLGAMLDLGREFHPDLTGRQNAELAAVVAGLSRRQFRQLLPEIVDFAELHPFVDEPLHAYSDGMRARLAFSVLAHVVPDVLLVDEVLGVGDASFQRRSVERIEVLRAGGTAVLFVSHDLDLVRRVCEEAVWLDNGTVRARGDAREVVASYLAAVAPTDEVGDPTGDGPIRSMTVCDAWGTPTADVQVGAGLHIRCEIAPDQERGHRNVSIVLRREGAATRAVDTSTPASGRGEAFEVRVQRLDLAPGRYHVVVEVFDGTWHERLGQRRAVLDVTGDGPEHAALAPPHEWIRRPT